MSNLPAVQPPLNGKTLLAVIAGGDCAALSPEQKLEYYNARCNVAGLDPRAQPFQFIRLQGKETLYATKAATDQLAAKHGIRVEILKQATENGIRTVTVRAIAADGRQTDEIGCVTVGNATGDVLCNIFMKAVTKAKRRAVLSICGLGMMDESELETVPGVNGTPPTVRRSMPMAPRTVEAQRVDNLPSSGEGPTGGDVSVDQGPSPPGVQASSPEPASEEPDYRKEYCKLIMDLAGGVKEDARRLSVELTTEADPQTGNIISGWPSVGSKRATPEAVKRAYQKAKAAWEKAFGQPSSMDVDGPAF